MNRKTGISIIIILVIILVGYTYLSQTREQENTNSGNEQHTNTVSDNSPQSNTTTPTANSSVYVSTQIPGSSVTIDSVNLEQAGFVVIHEVDNNGRPAKIIGASNVLSPGPKQDLEVNVTVAAGAKYIAMLHKDDGNSRFGAVVDTLILDSAGNPVMISFSVTR